MRARASCNVRSTFWTVAALSRLDPNIPYLRHKNNPGGQVESIPNSSVTVFMCANCARPGKEPSSAGRARPEVPDFGWPSRFQQVVIPCTGRLQPEHVLRAFESGANIVLVVACKEDNCHYIEGSRRCARRVDYVRSILREIGLGEERLLLSFLPGSAAEDLSLAAHKPVDANGSDSLNALIAEIRRQTLQSLQVFPNNPLRTDGEPAREEEEDE
jgi:F420-non-reducing hydrogenase iron-sulfur subunit